MSNDVTAYPLRWPAGWKRTPSRNTTHPFQRRRADGGYGHEPVSFDYARRTLSEELDRLGATRVTLSTNVPLRGDGLPYADAARRRMNDPGAAIYFMLKGRAMVMAQDRYADVAANLRSLALAIEGMRTLERHGGGAMMERAFDGFTALPPPVGVKPKRPWWEVLRYSSAPEERELLSVAEVRARFNTLARRGHSDAGGDADMDELTIARDDAVAAIEEGL